MIAFADVQRVRSRLAEAQKLAAQRYRDAFPLPAEAHLELQAAAMLECARGVRLRGTIRYEIRGDVVKPFVEQGRPIYPYFEIDRDELSIFEYWLIVSEIEATTSWRLTWIVASAEEYDEALRRMQQPQLVRAIVPGFLPEAVLRDDGTALLRATVYTRASEERVERRTLLLDESNELHFHSRELLAEGRGGVR